VLISSGREGEVLDLAARARPVTPWIEAGRLLAAGEPGAAADLFQAIGSLPSEAHARLLAAEALVAQGKRPQAEEQLARALEFYRGVKATAYVQRGEELLASTA